MGPIDFSEANSSAETVQAPTLCLPGPWQSLPAVTARLSRPAHARSSRPRDALTAG